MVDRTKICYMTKLAIYDKNEYKKDRCILRFFVNDYVYRQNMQTRIYVLIGYLMYVAFDYTCKISLGEVDIFLVNYVDELRKIAINAVVLLAAYTVISSVTATIRYYKAYKRQSNYFLIIEQMEKLGKTKQPAKEDDGENNGPNIVYKRNNR